MPTKNGRYVITTVQITPEQHAALAQLVWDHEYDSVSALIRERIDLFLSERSDNLTHASPLREEGRRVRTGTA